jgi:acetyl-CoA C-acetyltransferase
MTEVYLLGACRTPIGKFQGALSPLRAPELGGIAIREALRRAEVRAEDVQEVIFGNVLTAGLGQNPARQAARLGGVPDAVGSFTVNKVCGSGLKAVALAAQAIRAGDADVIVAGGQESMTNAPYLLPEARAGVRLGHGKLIDSMVFDGLWDIYNDFHMGRTAELVAEKFKIGRAEQDAFSVESQRRASTAMKAGKFDAEIVPVTIPSRKGEPVVVRADEQPRADSTVEALAKLKPAFQEKGTVTPGNASTINDGAAALVVASGEAVRRLKLKPMARVTGYATGGMAPEWVMMAPVEAVKHLTKKLGVTPAHFDLWEINEAFAVAAVALQREIGLDAAKVNVHGGAVALGHPIGATGARILTTLLHAMRDRRARTGCAALCLGGGNAVALAVEAVA